jgi:DNA-binding NtrC family response regulator
MNDIQVRVLCVDSSEQHRNQLASVLEEAGFDVWTSRNASDAALMADVLRPDAVVSDQTSTLRDESDWEKLTTAYPGMVAVVHSAAPDRGCSVDSSNFAAIRTDDPEMIMAILTLLLQPNRPIESQRPTHYVA